jgi:hypothetical protein
MPMMLASMVLKEYATAIALSSCFHILPRPLIPSGVGNATEET